MLSTSPPFLQPSAKGFRTLWAKRWPAAFPWSRPMSAMRADRRRFRGGGPAGNAPSAVRGMDAACGERLARDKALPEAARAVHRREFQRRCDGAPNGRCSFCARGWSGPERHCARILMSVISAMRGRTGPSRQALPCRDDRCVAHAVDESGFACGLSSSPLFLSSSAFCSRSQS